MELTIATGKGYVPADRNRPEDSPIGLIPVDSLFSPVKKVSYKVENTREGQILDYDKLTLTVETNGAVTPEMPSLMQRASCRISSSLHQFRGAARARYRGSKAGSAFNQSASEGRRAGISVRSANCLKNDNIIYIGDLVEKTEAEMLRTPNFGRKSLNEIKEVWLRWGCIWVWKFRDWPPENIEDLAKRYEDQY